MSLALVCDSFLVSVLLHILTLLFWLLAHLPCGPLLFSYTSRVLSLFLLLGSWATSFSIHAAIFAYFFLVLISLLLDPAYFITPVQSRQTSFSIDLSFLGCNTLLNSPFSFGQEQHTCEPPHALI
jgi:hypothetical protein